MKKVIVFILVALMALTYSFAASSDTSDTTALGIGDTVDATIDLVISESDVAGYRIGISSDAPGADFDSASHSMGTGVPSSNIDSIVLTYDSSSGTAKSGTAYFYYKAKGATSLKFDVTGPAMTAVKGQGSDAPTYLKYKINGVTAEDGSDATFWADQTIDLSTDGFDAGSVSLAVETEKILPIHIGTWQAKLTVTIKAA